MIGLDPGGREIDRRVLLGSDLVQGGIDLGGGDFQSRSRDIGTVEFVGQLHQRRIATPTHLGDQAAHGLGHIFLDLALGEQQRVEISGKIRIFGVQTTDHQGLSS